MSDWIKVSDSLPESPADVQVYCADTKEQFVAFHDKARKQFTYAMDHEGNSIGCLPTHWKPLGPNPEQ
ncbi:DUF551 domain-containing protein [Pseudomonas prosekii]|uniref:DUF551 domain-containing protein n=1 Tax=Pseudomonas prosekii TaxID=1148509 RepID=A0A1H2B1J8_9PSED|nr:DUF551 domain-containing protein [Pseudomonas prosekii]SDT52091.1 Protein of unknown function [Pseudomonas prosekii]